MKNMSRKNKELKNVHTPILVEKKEFHRDNSRGITLIILVITVIILSILAGTTINLLLSDIGMLKESEEATNKMNKEIENDAKETNELMNIIDNKLEEDRKKGTIVADGSYSEEKGVNTPKLAEGMTAITWDETANGGKGDWVEPKTADEWYNYTETDKKWANAKVTVEGVESYFVWIPRYAYQIESGYHKSGAQINTTNESLGAGKINIKFLKGTSNEGADGTKTWDNTSGEGNWNIHPAFSYGSNVSGIWVAKFEASIAGTTASTTEAEGQYDNTDKKLQVVPGVTSWRNIQIKNIYQVCLDYAENLNSHMMKNSEWGAVAYLAQSKYGKESEVWINPNSNFITGQAGTSVSAGETTTTYGYNDKTYGVQASTTGNVYGIYDMSGGAYEYVAAYVDNSYVKTNGNNYQYASNLIGGDPKTKDVYTMGSGDTQVANYAANSSKYGDAIYETSYNASGDSDTKSWYADYLVFPYSYNPFFLRGGYYGHTSYAGLFYFDCGHGLSREGCSFRPVLVAL